MWVGGSSLPSHPKSPAFHLIATFIYVRSEHNDIKQKQHTQMATCSCFRAWCSRSMRIRAVSECTFAMRQSALREIRAAEDGGRSLLSLTAGETRARLHTSCCSPPQRWFRASACVCVLPWGSRGHIGIRSCMTCWTRAELARAHTLNCKTLSPSAGVSEWNLND
jgi:hypothetical protein